MQLTYKYRLKPTKAQLGTIVAHLELCRRQYNYRLSERFRWWESTRTPVNACPLTASIVSVEEIYQNIPLTRVQTRDGRKKDESGNPLTRKGDVFSNVEGGYVQWQAIQLADLKNTKKLFPDYKALNSQVLQDVVNRVETSFSNFTTPDKNGNRRGKPKFKGFDYYKSFTYPQLDNLDIIKDEQNIICVNLAKIGQVPMVFHRPIPTGFTVKTGTVIREADRWYIALTLEDKAVPVTVAEIQPTDENTLGIDLGITNYVYLSNGERVENPRFLRRYAEKLARLQAKLASRVKGSKPWQVIKSKISRLHQFVARARLDFQFKTAHELFRKCDVLVVEDLSVKNLTRRAKAKTDIDNNGNLVYLPNGQSAKSGLNKSMLDAAHGQFASVLKYVAWKLGKNVLLVNPKGTSQYCWNCLNKVSKELSERCHSCQCGESLERDENSAKLIKKIGLIHQSGGGASSLKKALAQREIEACGLTVLR
ncbi:MULTISPECIES: transposase [unclassified Microcoleus]|uniref:RNA-guided endonuclease InsQ/TnpB family protein n=1 Tax=unclassified Microcoleus TaxID=2642155 RepID=UPI0025FAC515|nr:MULTISPECIES: transposase [unclassified Microcoleus]